MLIHVPNDDHITMDTVSFIYEYNNIRDHVLACFLSGPASGSVGGQASMTIIKRWQMAMLRTGATTELDAT